MKSEEGNQTPAGDADSALQQLLRGVPKRTVSRRLTCHYPIKDLNATALKKLTHYKDMVTSDTYLTEFLVSKDGNPNLCKQRLNVDEIGYQ